MINMDIVIRSARIEDVDAILEVTREAFRIYQKLAQIDGKLEALEESADDLVNDIKNSIVLAAVVDSEVVGCVRVKLAGDGTAYLYRFGVVHKHQRLGLGKKLLAAVDVEMRKRGVGKITLHTASRHSRLVRFYYACGYYIDSSERERGYIRALFVKEYE